MGIPQAFLTQHLRSVADYKQVLSRVTGDRLATRRAMSCWLQYQGPACADDGKANKSTCHQAKLATLQCGVLLFHLLLPVNDLILMRINRK
jgi:hypothetical protein